MLEHVVRLLELTDSDNDEHVASAAREAYDLLRKHGLQWNDVIIGAEQRQRVVAYSDKPGKLYQRPKEHKAFDLMFDEVMKSRPRDNGKANFIKSLRESYNKYRRLTPRQEAALRRFHSNIRR